MRVNQELYQRAKYEIKLLEDARENYILRLNKLGIYKDGMLRVSTHGKNNYYYVKHRGDKRYRYIGRSDHKVVKRVREARYLKEAIRRIDLNISLLKAITNGYKAYDPSSVNESLPEVYRCKVPPVSELYEREGAKWKARQLEFQKRYPENYPEHKTQRTSDNVMVKTISEVTLYEIFKAAGLVQVYELPLPMKDYGPAIYPDFTILSPIDMKSEIIVEYAGRLDDWKYNQDFARRISRYLNNGYKLGVNLFIVYGDRDGNIDATQIAKVIADIKGL